MPVVCFFVQWLQWLPVVPVEGGSYPSLYWFPLPGARISAGYPWSAAAALLAAYEKMDYATIALHRPEILCFQCFWGYPFCKGDDR